MPISLTLKQARKAKGWTQKQLEAASGIQQGTISRLERRSAELFPAYTTVYALEDALGLKRGTLVFGQREAVAS
jgi:transcriptional regulator with XRE-family HTH domain